MNKERYYSLDFIKGLAISAIILYHLLNRYAYYLPEKLMPYTAIGGTGTHAFIFSSGFGLMLSSKKSNITLKSYFLKRFLKIYLPYILVILFLVLFIPNYNYVKDYLDLGYTKAEILLSHALLYKMFLPELDESCGPYFWYMSTIFQFYIFFPLLKKIYEKLKAKKYLVFSFVISVAWALFIIIIKKDSIRTWNSCFLQLLFDFSFGMVIADNIEKSENLFNRCSSLWFLSIGVFSYFVVFMMSRFQFGSVLNDIFSAFGFISCGLFLYKLNIRPLQKLFILISYISYELYLTSFLATRFIYSQRFSLIFYNGYLQAVLVALSAISLSIAVALLYHIFIKYIYKKIHIS